MHPYDLKSAFYPPQSPRLQYVLYKGSRPVARICGILAEVACIIVADITCVSEIGLKPSEGSQVSIFIYKTYLCPWWTLDRSDTGCGECHTPELLIQTQTAKPLIPPHHMAMFLPVFLFGVRYKII